MAENLNLFNLVVCKRSRRQSLTPSPPPKSFRRVPLAEIKNESVRVGGDDDVFDEAFFLEVDAICEERSGVKIPKESEEGAMNDGGLDFLGFWDENSEKAVEESATNCDFFGFQDGNSERVVEKSAMNDDDCLGLLDRNSERRVVNDRNGGFVGFRNGNSERETDENAINCGGFDQNVGFLGSLDRNSEREMDGSVINFGGLDGNGDFLGFSDRNSERKAEGSAMKDGGFDGNGDFLGFSARNSENVPVNDGGADENDDFLGFFAVNSERTAEVSVPRDDLSKSSMWLNEESAVKSDIFDWDEEVSGFSARNSERVAEESLVNIGGFDWDEEVLGLSTPPEAVANETMVSGGSFDGNEEVVGFSTKKNQERAAEESVVNDGLHRDRVEGMPGKYLEYFQKLNEAQREAACSDVSVPLMIVAGPGSGKTSTMVGRVLTFLKEGIGPSNILAMTFTTAAASEMRDRIGAVVGKAIAKEIMISTFHSFCLKLCRDHAEKLARTPEFLIYGHGQQRKATIEALRLVENGQEHGERKGNSAPRICDDILKSFKEKSKKWQKFVTQAKAYGRTPEECEKLGDAIGALILRHYGEILASCNALDYHDLISSSVKLLTDFPDVYLECQDKWKAIVVDEFQDTSSMQYCLLRILSSHKRVTIVGDEDQSIFSFNGANCCGFDSFRRDFPNHKEIKLTKNYRSTRYIVEAASALICNNKKRCYLKQVEADNSSGCKIVVKECHSEEAQCAFVTDKILEITGDNSVTGRSFGNVAVLYRRQVSGKTFQVCFRDRKIPFNTHGVAFYRKKVIKAIMALLRTTLPDCDDGPYRQAFKALLPGDKGEKKMMIDYVERICSARKCNFLSAATDIFNAKVSGTFKRAQLTQGRKVLSMLDMLTKLVRREQSISMVISAAANMLPQKYLFEQRAVIDAEGGKLLNEDNDLRSVLQYLMDDVSDFLSTHSIKEEAIRNEEKGCVFTLNAFIDFIFLRESENFRSRRQDNDNSVTLTTIHQSKGLEWDTVFIVKANDSEIPLLHEFNGVAEEGGTTVEEERRLLYVAITRAKRELYILYLTVDSNWQLLQPSRFLKEIPVHLLDIQGHAISKETALQPARELPFNPLQSEPSPVEVYVRSKTEVDSSVEISDPGLSINSNFLKRFNVEDRSIVSHLFHQWAKRPAFQQSNRLLGKISFVIDERLRNKTYKHKDIMRLLKSCLKDEEAFQYAEYIIKWEQIPVEQRAHLMREKQEHFQRQRIENSMGSAEATPKQIAYLHKLGCTVVPTSRLHASKLIEQYKTL